MGEHEAGLARAEEIGLDNTAAETADLSG